MMKKDSDRLNRECVDPDWAVASELFTITRRVEFHGQATYVDAWENHSRHGYLHLPRQHAGVWKYDRLNGSCIDFALSGQVTLIIN